MRIIIFTSLFLIPFIGFASLTKKATTQSDTTIETNTETMEEYKIRIQNQLYSQKSEQPNYFIERKKRKNFVFGGSANLYSRLENNLSLNFGSILFDQFYFGIDISDYIFLAMRVYAPKINLYLTAKSGSDFKIFSNSGSILKCGLGYDYYLNQNISINSEISFYKYEREWTTTTISYTGATNSDPLDFFDGWNSNSTDHYESYFAPAFSLSLQIHF